MEIVEYQDKYKEYFIQFNTDWIKDYFGFLEEEDIATFQHIEESLKQGAMIYFALENGNILATCMAKPSGNDGTWEICKLGSNKRLPHKGAGSAVFEAAMKWAVSHGARKLFILSNSRLKAALHIYEKYGFHEVKLTDYEYIRGDIAFEYCALLNSPYVSAVFHKAPQGILIQDILHPAGCQDRQAYAMGNIIKCAEFVHGS